MRKKQKKLIGQATQWRAVVFRCQLMAPGNNLIQNKQPKLFAFGRLPIQRRLPFFICILLLTVVLLFSWLSYLGVRNASMAMANELPAALYRKTADLYLGWIFITGIMAVVIGSAGGWIMGRSITRPLH
ncbi:MAG: hypothetical protein ACXVIY_05680 [Mucilaginibacter sp.]